MYGRWRVDTEALREFIHARGLPLVDQSKKSWIFDCPRCQKHKKLYIRKSDGRFICWYCAAKDNYQGKPEYALCDLSGLDLETIRNEIYPESPKASEDLEISLKTYYPGIDDEDETEGLLVVEEVSWPYGYHPIEDPAAKKGLAYLQSRGISLDLAQRYGLYYSVQERSVVFPIRQFGRLVGWQRRPIFATEWVDEHGEARRIPKYQSSLESRSHVLMFEENLEDSKHCVLTEGPIDAIKAHLCGGNVCTMGKAVDVGQVERIAMAGIDRVYLALDRDAGQETENAVRWFARHGIDAYWMQPPPEKDLGDMTLEEVKYLFDQAAPVSAATLFVSFD